MVRSPRQRDRRTASAVPAASAAHGVTGASGSAAQRRQSGCGDHESRPVERPFRRRRRLAGLRPRQPIARETRNDAAADERDERQERCNADAVAELGRLRETHGVQMHEKIADEEQRQGGEHRQVAPVAAGQDLARHDGEEEGRKGEIEDCRGGSAQCRGEENRGPAGGPSQQEKRERPALQRHSPRPVGDGGEEKAGDSRGGKAIDHLVDVPDDGGKRARNDESPGIGGKPQRHRKRCPAGRREEERAKTGREERRSVMRAVAGDGHHRKFDISCALREGEFVLPAPRSPAREKQMGGMISRLATGLGPAFPLLSVDHAPRAFPAPPRETLADRPGAHLEPLRHGDGRAHERADPRRCGGARPDRNRLLP